MPYPNLTHSRIHKFPPIIPQKKHRNCLNPQPIKKHNENITLSIPGLPGKSGSKIYVKSAPPENNFGNVNDLYLDNLTNDYYQKFTDGWQYQGNLTGNKGDPGSNIIFDNGIPSKMIGKNGDMYIDKTNGYTYHKIDGNWVYQLKLVGPRGERGSKIFAADKPPENSKNNDLFINTTDNSYYIMVDNVWILKGNLSSSSPNVEKISYNLFSIEVVATTTNPVFISIAYFPWYFSRYSSFTDGTLVFSTVIKDRNLLVKIVDNKNNTIIGPYTVSQSGINAIPFKVPKYETILTLQICRNYDGGTRPAIFGANLEFEKLS